LRERAVLTGAVVLFFLVGYFGVGWLVTDPADAHSLATPLDAAIPFLLGSVVVYWSILPMGLLPVFVVADRDVFRRVALAYSVTIAVALAIFVVFPVSSAGFRPDAAAYSDAGFAGWLLRLLHVLDPPLNLFPSLHLALAFLAALAAVRVRSPLGAVALIWTLCIAVSVCTTKQHFAVDAVAGLALAALVHRALVANPRAPAASADASFGARGIALFAGLVALFYAGLYGAYLVGFEPWNASIG
jgi:membrane-associated phospholipid phosphatase